jgi:hypothetical protein
MRPSSASRDDTRDDHPQPQDDLRSLGCPSCGGTFRATGRQTYCSAACRQRAYRQRSITTDTQAAMQVPPTRTRRDLTIYQCPQCDEVLLGQQWCTDCQRPCRRLGLGGACPHCDEPVTVDQLLNATP